MNVLSSLSLIPLQAVPSATRRTRSSWARCRSTTRAERRKWKLQLWATYRSFVVSTLVEEGRTQSSSKICRISSNTLTVAIKRISSSTTRYRFSSNAGKCQAKTRIPIFRTHILSSRKSTSLSPSTMNFNHLLLCTTAINSHFLNNNAGSSVIGQEELLFLAVSFNYPSA